MQCCGRCGVRAFEVSEASMADRIASATRRTITEKMDEDPTFYRSFSELLEVPDLSRATTMGRPSLVPLKVV